MFSINSDVTLVITSCGRFELLKETLSSFLAMNTYPIREIIIIEDSGDKGVNDYIPDDIKKNTTVIVNEKNIGQMRSIDKAYQQVTTDFIFHCEDDWQFYRGGFIEDSKSVLKDSSIITVQLRSINDDMLKNYPFHSLGDEQVTGDSVHFYTLLSDSLFRGFTFNPSLKRKKDYEFIGRYYRPAMSSGATECFVSNFYEVHGMSTAILKESAVKHIGWDEHVCSPEEIKAIKYKKKRKIKHLTLGFLVGIIFGIGLKCLI